MKTAWSWLVRALVAAVCIFLTVRTARMAIADERAQHNGIDGLASALRLEPGDSVLLARSALYKNNTGDTSPEVDRELQRAAAADPLNAELPMALGLREEFRGHLDQAERDLVHAAAIDHTFKPAWTLANFYIRNGQTEKSWPLIQRALNLNPLAFDPTPIFDLCWSQTDDAREIAALIPQRGNMPLAYLAYLIGRRKPAEALDFWPRTLALLDPAVQIDIDVSTSFVEFLEQADRTPDAVRVWNQMVARKIIASGKLDPAAGVSVANPDFAYPLIERGFGWRATQENGVSVVKGSASMRFEFDGNQPESSLLLTTMAPLVPGKAYRLIWKTDASRLTAPRDPGFLFQVVQQPGNVTSECQPLLKAGDDGSCPFTSRPDADRAQLNLIYRRALGTTRVEGMIQILSVRLEFGS